MHTQTHPATKRTLPLSTVATRLVPVESPAMLVQLNGVVPGINTRLPTGVAVGANVLPPLLPASQV